jgi:DNA end-binding protein Ku
MTLDFDPDEYHDNYREALQELVTAKVEGREVVQLPETGPGEEEPSSLADALRASLEAAKSGRPRPVPDADGSARDSAQKPKEGAGKAGTTKARAGTGRTGTAKAETAKAGTAKAETAKAETAKAGTAKSGSRRSSAAEEREQDEAKPARRRRAS